MYDIVIIGSGPAGLTAGIYATRSNLKTLLIEKGMIGGQVTLTHEIDNYPAMNGINGFDLMSQMFDHATSLGVEFLNEEVLSVEDFKDYKLIKTTNKSIQAKTVILALGARARKLEVEGEAKFTNRGVAYCAVCDGSIYKNKPVVVVGGGNSAVEDAIYLSELASSVIMVNKKNDFSCNEVLKVRINELVESGKVSVFHDSVIYEIKGTNKVEELVVKCPECKFPSIKTDAVFVAVGRIPDSEIVKNLNLTMDSKGYIITNDEMETNLAGVYACGDVRKKEMNQIITACSDGAIAANSANKFIKIKLK